ncbi:hypothetical protein BCC0238_001314 [Burkholderia gladioli]
MAVAVARLAVLEDTNPGAWERFAAVGTPSVPDRGDRGPRDQPRF